MTLPETIQIYSLTIKTVYLFIFMGTVSSLFVLWRQGTKDGFGYERLFDLFFAIFGFSAGIVYAANLIFKGQHLGVIVQSAVFLVSLVAINYFSGKWSWSRYRVGDIFGLALLTFLVFFLGARGMWYYLGVSLISLFLFTYFREKLMSGVVTSILLAGYALLSFIAIREITYLIFYSALITISMLNIVSRLSLLKKK